MKKLSQSEIDFLEEKWDSRQEKIQQYILAKLEQEHADFSFKNISINLMTVLTTHLALLINITNKIQNPKIQPEFESKIVEIISTNKSIFLKLRTIYTYSFVVDMYRDQYNDSNSFIDKLTDEAFNLFKDESFQKETQNLIQQKSSDLIGHLMVEQIEKDFSPSMTERTFTFTSMVNGHFVAFSKVIETKLPSVFRITESEEFKRFHKLNEELLEFLAAIVGAELVGIVPPIEIPNIKG